MSSKFHLVYESLFFFSKGLATNIDNGYMISCPTVAAIPAPIMKFPISSHISNFSNQSFGLIIITNKQKVMNLLDKIDELHANNVTPETFEEVWGMTIEEHLQELMEFVEKQKQA